MARQTRMNTLPSWRLRMRAVIKMSQISIEINGDFYFLKFRMINFTTTSVLGGTGVYI